SRFRRAMASVRALMCACLSSRTDLGRRHNAHIQGNVADIDAAQANSWRHRIDLASNQRGEAAVVSRAILPARPFGIRKLIRDSHPKDWRPLSLLSVEAHLSKATRESR